MRTHGVPEAILTDNGKVFTGRFGPGTGEVLFDRICRENGIKHLLTAPRSPTTTGKVERFHRTLRGEFLTGKVFASIDEAQGALDAWVATYNHDRPHQSIGMVAPFERFRLAASEAIDPVDPDVADPGQQPPRHSRRPPLGQRRNGWAAKGSSASPPPAIEPVCGWPARMSASSATVVSCTCSTGTCLSPPMPGDTARQTSGRAAQGEPSSAGAPATIGLVGVGHSQGRFFGQVCFAGTSYRVGSKYRRRQVQVAVVGEAVEISIGKEVIRTYSIHHDRTREHGALANPGGRPRGTNAA